MKAIKNLKFEQRAYPEVLKVVNHLAELEQRKPHDTAKRILLQEGQKRIEELTSNCLQPQSACAG